MKGILMNAFNIDNLLKALLAVILLSITTGQFGRLQRFALKEGIRAITPLGYKPTYFFSR